MLKAITRSISPEMSNCELTHLVRQPIDIQKAVHQHEQYEKTLTSLGVQIIKATSAPDLPDSVFVEDCAIVLDELAIITLPGAVSRRPEVKGITEALTPFRKLFYIQAPGILDGGDVLIIGKKIWVGLSNRSNQIAIQQLEQIVMPHGYEVKGVSVTGCLHLKSAVTQLAEKTVLLNHNWVDEDIFNDFEIIKTHPSEPHAANALMIGTKVLFPKAYPLTAQILKDQGIEVIEIDNSEVIKAEGALTCCSIVFRDKRSEK